MGIVHRTNGASYDGLDSVALDQEIKTNPLPESFLQPIRDSHAADRNREHLMLERITRGLLLKRTKTRQPIHTHDTRATFPTISSAKRRSQITAEQVAALANNLQFVGLRQGLAMLAG